MSAKITVLVVEDEALLRMNTVDELTDLGLEVMEASNAKEAIALLRVVRASNACSLMWTCRATSMVWNWQMVKDAYPPIAVIVTSGHWNVTRDDLPHRGVFVGKPYSLDAVGDLIRRLTTSDV